MEGPSLHILADELQIFVKQKIKDIYGNAKFDKNDLMDLQIKEIYAFGKRLIIQLTDHAITTHFLMYGSYKINEQKDMAPRLAIITSNNNSLFLYNCSIKCVKTSNLKKILPLDLDILSNDWDIKKIIKIIKSNANETIDDILLDQEIFPGVGNIIKNEALYLSKVAPNVRVSKLSDKKLKNIAEQTRTFSENFFKWRKNFELKKHLKIYRKKICSICNSKVIRKKTGKKQRWSYICPICQNYQLNS